MVNHFLTSIDIHDFVGTHTNWYLQINLQMILSVSILPYEEHEYEHSLLNHVTHCNNKRMQTLWKRLSKQNLHSLPHTRRLLTVLWIVITSELWNNCSRNIHSIDVVAKFLSQLNSCIFPITLFPDTCKLCSTHKLRNFVLFCIVAFRSQLQVIIYIITYVCQINFNGKFS